MSDQPVKPWYQSMKLIAAAVALVLIFVNAWINHQTIDPNSVTQAVSIVIGAYIAAKAYEDGEQAKARVKAATPTTTLTTPAPNVTVTTTAAPNDPAIVTPGKPKPRVNLTGLE